MGFSTRNSLNGACNSTRNSPNGASKDLRNSPKLAFILVDSGKMLFLAKIPNSLGILGCHAFWKKVFFVGPKGFWPTRSKSLETDKKKFFPKLRDNLKKPYKCPFLDILWFSEIGLGLLSEIGLEFGFWKWKFHFHFQNPIRQEIGLSESKHSNKLNFQLKNLKTYFGKIDSNKLTRRHRDFLTVFSCAHTCTHACVCAGKG